MYAITSTSYRAIGTAGDAMPSETVVYEVPAELTAVWALHEGRRTVSALLRASDWTQMPDCTLTALERSAWATYRQTLRDLPAQSDFPECAWPSPPSATDIANEAGTNGD